MRMQVPVDVGHANVFLDDASHRALREPPARIIEEHRFGLWPLPATPPIPLLQELLAQRPVFFQRFLRFRSVRNDAFLVALAADAEHAFLLLHVGKIKAGEFADAQACGVQKFQKRSVAPKRSEEHTSELQSPDHLVCRLLLEKKKTFSPLLRVRSREDLNRT